MYPWISRLETLTVAQYDECKDAATADELENLGCVVETIVDASGLSVRKDYCKCKVGYEPDTAGTIRPLLPRDFICVDIGK